MASKYSKWTGKLSSATIKKRNQKRNFKVVVIAVAAILFFGAFRMIIRPVIHFNEIQTAKTDAGDIDASISASGIILPEFEEIIASPVTSRISKVHHNIGEIVKKEVNVSIFTGVISSINPTVQNDAVKFTVMLEEKNNPVIRSKFPYPFKMTENTCNLYSFYVVALFNHN